MKIKCGEFDVCSNGSVIAYEENPVEMILADDGDDIYTFRLSFKNDQANENERTEFRPVDDTTMEINFVNANRAFGIGPQKPVEIGVFKNRKLYFSYRIYSSSSSFREKLLHYTWLLGEEAESSSPEDVPAPEPETADADIETAESTDSNAGDESTPSSDDPPSEQPQNDNK